MHMHMDRGVQLFGDHPDFLQVFIADGVGCVGAEGNFDALVMLEIAEQFDALTNGFVRLLAPGIGKSRIGMAICARMPLLCTHSLATFGKKYMSEKQVMPPLICSAMARSVPSRTKVFIDPFGFGRPDVVFQPGHQRQIISQATEQCHRRMAVGIDQARGRAACPAVRGFRSR